MPTYYYDLGFDSFAERRDVYDLPPLDTPFDSLQGMGVATGVTEIGPAMQTITSSNVGDTLGDRAIGFDKLDIVIGQGTNTVGLTGVGAESTSIRIWAGETFGNRGSAPFRVTAAGAVTASSISIVGGDVGGWVITATTLYGLSSGTPTVAPNNGIVMTSGATSNIVIYEGLAERVRIGNLSAGVFGIRGFATDGTTVIFEFSDTRQIIGGWNFTDTVLRTGATDAASNVLIDSTNSLFRLGPTTGASITIDGANQRIRSSTYVTGVTGFTVEPGLVEAQNILARGTMSGTVFRYDVISATGGRQIIANADALSTAMTALDASTLTIRGNITLAANDIVIIRAQSSGGIQEEYLRVTSAAAAPTYSVTRDLAATYAVDTNPAWPAGTVVVQQGVSDGAAAFSGGWLDLVGEASSGSDWPRVSVFQRTGVAYNAFTERVRMGNLNGYLGYVADTYGFAVGSSVAGEANITFDATNGIRIRQGTTNLITFNMSGTATLLNLTVGGSLNVLTAGNFRSGQTAYNTGIGWFMEYNAGTPRFSIGDGTVINSLTWDGTTLSAVGTLISVDRYTAAEDIVALDRISVITTASQAERTIRHNFANPGAFQTIAGTAGTQVPRCARVTANKIAVFYVDGTDYIVVIGTVDRTTLAITWGAETVVGTGATSSHRPDILYMSDDKLAFMYTNDAARQNIAMRIATISGTTPTFGAELVLDTTATSFHSLSMDLRDTDNIICAHIEEVGVNETLHVYNVTVSGTTITSFFANEVTQTDAGDENDGVRIVATSTSNSLVVYAMGATVNGNAWRVTWLGNTPTSSTTALFAGGASPTQISAVAETSTGATYVVVLFRVAAATINVVAINATTVVVGTSVNVVSVAPTAIGNGDVVNLIRIANNRFFYTQRDNALGPLDVAELIIIGDTMRVVASTNSFESSNWSSTAGATLDESRVKFVFGGYIAGGTALQSFNTWSEYDNTDTMIGIASSTVSSGGTVAVYGKDAVVTGFVGLTVGSKYYINYRTNTLTTTNTGAQIGIAKTTTNMKVDVNTKFIYRSTGTLGASLTTGVYRFYHNAGTLPVMVFMHGTMGQAGYLGQSDASYGSDGTYTLRRWYSDDTNRAGADNSEFGEINTTQILALLAGATSLTATVQAMTKFSVTLNVTVAGAVGATNFIYETHT